MSRRWDTILVAALTIGAAMSPASTLGPNSLWLDDAWPALVTKADSLRDFLFTAGTAPGFALLLRGWLGLAGFTELHAQLLPFIAGVAAVPVIYAVALRGFGPRTALIAAGIIAGCPTRATYSTHVKQYSLEIVLASVILASSMLLLRAEPKRWYWPVAVGSAIVATVFSGALALLGATGLGVAAARSVLRREAHAARAFVMTLAFGVFAAVWWALVLRPAVYDALRAHWAGHYIDLDGAEAFTTTVIGLRRMFFLFVPAAPIAWITAALFVVGLVALWSRDRAVTLIVGLPVAGAVALAAAHAAPLGARTDQYLYAALAIGAAAGADALLSMRRASLVERLPPVALIVTLLLVAFPVAIARAGPYPAQDVKPLVRRIEKSRLDAITLVYWPTAYAFGLYTQRPIRLVPSERAANGFIVAPSDPSVHVLPLHTDRPDRYRADIAPFTARYDRIRLVASHLLVRGDDLHIANALYDAGYELKTSDWTEGAYAMVWERTSRSDRRR